MMGSRSYICQTEGCEYIAAWWVKAEYTKHVCHRCRDELIAVYDYELLEYWNET